MSISIQDTLQIADNFFSAGDYKNAYNSYTDAAQKGSGEAAYKLGQMYEKGIYVKRDYKAAMQWYVIAAGKGNKEAKEKFLKGLPKEEDPKEELKEESKEEEPKEESKEELKEESKEEPNIKEEDRKTVEQTEKNLNSVVVPEIPVVPKTDNEPFIEPEIDFDASNSDVVQPTTNELETPSIVPPPYIPKADIQKQNDEDIKQLEDQLKTMLSNKDYKKAYDLCLDYLDECRCSEYIQSRLPKLRKDLSNYYAGKRTLHIVLFIITVIIGMTVSILVRSNM